MEWVIYIGVTLMILVGICGICSKQIKNFYSKLSNKIISKSISAMVKIPGKGNLKDDDINSLFGMIKHLPVNSLLIEAQIEVIKERYKKNPELTPEEIYETSNADYIRNMSEMGIDILDLARQVKQSM